MDWKMLYISGRPYFVKEVLVHISRSGFTCLPGTSLTNDKIAVWIDKSASVVDLKRAIGAKLIFKYRLRISEQEDEPEDQSQSDTFTPQELSLINKMKTWERSQKRKGKATDTA